jgi:hypothetical protein
MRLSTKVDFTTGDPISVVMSDLNGDGKPDLAVANYSPRNASVFLNTTATSATTPNFAAKVDFTTGSSPSSIATGDLNGDGMPDLAVANRASNTISVFARPVGPPGASSLRHLQRRRLVNHLVAMISMSLASCGYHASYYEGTICSGVCPGELECCDGVCRSLGPKGACPAMPRDSGADVQSVDVLIDAPSACASGRKLFLHFDGIALNKAATSDSTQDVVSWMGNTTVNLPAYHAGVGTRVTEIQSIVDGIKTRLTGLPIDIVTVRPSAGPYVMIVFGGSNTTNTGSTSQVETQYSYGWNEHDCGDVVTNDVGWVADLPPVDLAPDIAVGVIGWGLGLNGTNNVNGCMCGWANTCQNAAGPCVLSSSIASTTSTGSTTCPNQNPQNEIGAFSTGYCQ